MAEYIIPEASIFNDNTGTLVTVINSDTTAFTINNVKVQGLVNLGTHAFSAYPLVLGVDVPHDSLNNLTNVSITSPVAGQALVWNGTDWVNGAPTVTPPTLGTPASDLLLTTTSPTTLTTYTPSTNKNMVANVYASVKTAPTALTLSLSYQDANIGNLQTYNWINNLTLPVASGAFFAPAFFNAASGVAVTVTGTAGTANQVAVSASLDAT